MESIRVLDHGYVKFVASMGTDETIVEAARMSTGRGFEGWDWWDGTAEGNELKSPDAREVGGRGFGREGDPPHHWDGHVPGSPRDAKLLEFLYKNKHMTPFEMCELQIEVQAPIMVFREWHRHRTQSYNEFSARYSQMPNLHYLPTLDRVQKQSASNKQSSGDPVDAGCAESFLTMARAEQEGLYSHYDTWITSDGIAKEAARLNTPVSREKVFDFGDDDEAYLRWLEHVRRGLLESLARRQCAPGETKPFRGLSAPSLSPAPWRRPSPPAGRHRGGAVILSLDNCSHCACVTHLDVRDSAKAIALLKPGELGCWNCEDQDEGDGHVRCVQLVDDHGAILWDGRCDTGRALSAATSGEQ